MFKSIESQIIEHSKSAGNNQVIVVTGVAASGKSTYVNQMANGGGFIVIRLDEYVLKDHSALYQVIDDIRYIRENTKDNRPILVEGIDGARLIRKVGEIPEYELEVDLVILCEISETSQRHIYVSQRPRKDFTRVKGQNKAFNTVWQDAMRHYRNPVWRMNFADEGEIAKDFKQVAEFRKLNI